MERKPQEEPDSHREGAESDPAGESIAGRRPFAVRLGRTILAAGAIAWMLAFVARLFFTAQTELIVIPLAGLTAALAVDGAWDAAVAAAAGVLAGCALAPVFSTIAWGTPAEWLPTALVMTAVAAALAAAVNVAVRRSERLRALLTVAVIAIVLASAWSYALVNAALPTSDGLVPARVLGTTPVIGSNSGDALVYVAYAGKVRSGANYYRAVAETLQTANAQKLRFDASSVLSFRLPTLYFLLAALGGGLAPFAAMMACGSLAALAAFMLTRRLAALPPALAATAGVAGYYAFAASDLSVAFPELWAGAFGLVSLALLVESIARPERRSLAFGAVAAAVAAALFRELAVPFLLLGLAATLFGPAQARRRWPMWAGAIAVIAVAYGAHWWAAADVVRSMAIPHIAYKRLPWLHYEAQGLAASTYMLAFRLAVHQAAAWAVIVFAAIGSLVGPRERTSRFVIGVCVVAGELLLLVLYPTGNWGTSGLPPGYWADVMIPTLLACAPLALTLVPGGHREADGEA